jgi:hypothetical protein
MHDLYLPARNLEVSIVAIFLESADIMQKIVKGR